MYKQKDLQNDTEKITNMFVDCRSSYKIPKHILKYQRIGKKELWKPSEAMEGFCCVISLTLDRLCGLVVRVSGYRYRGPGFDPRRYRIF